MRLAAVVAGDDARLSMPDARRTTRARYPADPPTVEQIVAVMRKAGDSLHGQRLPGLIVVLWRAGLRTAKRSRSVSPTRTHAAARS